MNRAIQLHNHPFRFLLYLEWGLIAVAIISALESPPARHMRRAVRGPLRDSAGGAMPTGPALPDWYTHSPFIAVSALVIFGLMGLYLPAQRLPKLGHTLGQIGLILLSSVTVLNDGRTFPFIYLVLVIRGCLIYGLAGRLLLTGTTFVLFLGGLFFRLRTFTGIGRRLPPDARDRLQNLVMGFHINFIALFGLALLLVVLLINALLTERKSQQRLQQANQTLRQSAQEIEKLAMDQERSRIARDIHDALGHSLTALNIQIESAVKLWEKDPQRAKQFLDKAKSLGTQSLQEVRQSVTALRQDPLAGKTLESAIASLIQDIQAHRPQQLTITPQIQVAQPLPNNLKVLLYRVVQEGLTNIVKHAKASQVRLQLVSSGAIVSLNLEDDGQGFELTQARTGFGLQSMRDRAESVGGTFVVDSSAKGTRIQISLPIRSISS